ncbi:MAG: hypothetical protein IH984_03270 [Planctomycetes bacterium]|nr:hypothetical protein [Planctomycetota bacterium]
MYLTKRIGLVVGAAALTVTGGSFADTVSGASNDDLKVLLNSALVRIDQLEAKQNNVWLTEQRADEIRGLVQDVLADADTRASLLAQGITAGYDDGAHIASSDGNWSLHTNIHMQQRFIYNNRDNPAGGTIDESRYGFENPRTKFILSGNIVNPQWIYKIEINVGSPGGSLGPSRAGTGDAYLGYKYDDGLTVLFGTMKAPFLREELVDSRYQLAVERSLLNYTFTTGRSDGIALDYMADQFHITGMISDGANTGQTAAFVLVPETEFAITGRIEWLAQGNWDQFSDFTNRDSEQGVMVGAALHYESLEAGILPDTDITLFTVDVSAEFEGANLYAAYIYSDVDITGFPTVNASGFLVQGGLNFGDDWEAFARYEFADFDITGVEDLGLITFGVNKYIAGHNAKWTTDIGIGTDTIVLPAAITGTRMDSGTEDGQLVIRSQIQFVF